MASMSAQDIAMAYLKAFLADDQRTARSYLADKGAFIGPLQSFTKADDFLREGQTFARLTKDFTIKKVLADGTDVCVFWDYTTHVPSIPVTPIAEWFKVEERKITFVQLHFNAIPVAAAMQRGEIAQALKALGG